MRVIPVLDLKGGLAVRAVAGHRSQYGPLQSLFCGEPDPVGLARGLRNGLGTTEVYIADLDAIEGRAEPAWTILRVIADLGLSIWADIGIPDSPVPPRLKGSDVARIVAGLETLRGPDALARIVQEVGPERLTLSLDLRAGVPILPENHTWVGDPQSEINLVGQAVEAGVLSIIRLDLADVGTGRGVANIPQIPDRSDRSGVEWITGGGVTGPADLATLARLGYSAALVGSAIHDGRIRRAEIEATRQIG